MKALALRKPLFLLLFLLFFTAPAPAQETALRRLALAHGISLEIPAQWDVQPPQTSKALEATREALTGKAGVENPRGKKEELLAASATPAPAGATIRLNVSSPASFSQADLATTGPEGLQALHAELLVTFQKVEAAGGPKILDVQTPRLERINDHLALCIPYLRAGAPEKPPWEVTQYKIPVAGRLIELTLSHQQTEAAKWKPVLEQVKRSLRF
jgi:hypothetical protein